MSDIAMPDPSETETETDVPTVEPLPEPIELPRKPVQAPEPDRIAA